MMYENDRKAIAYAVEQIREVREEVASGKLRENSGCVRHVVQFMRKTIKDRQFDDMLHARELMSVRLKDNTHKDGKVRLTVWSRDCDLCESTEMVIINPSVVEYENFINHLHDDAEGPVSVDFLTEEQAADFEPDFYDRGLAIFEERGYGH